MQSEYSAFRIIKEKIIYLQQLRIIVLAIRGFLNDKVQLRASALTFYSLSYRLFLLLR